ATSLCCRSSLPSEGEVNLNNSKHHLEGMIENFFELLKKYSDNPDNADIFINFIRLFLRTKSSGAPLPTVELMSLIKKEKPEIFAAIRQRGKYDLLLEFVTSIHMDTANAEERMKQYLSKIAI
ncbi:MAG TPA: hypothetical protein VEV44_05060, partial [Pseudoneobacillus sp.]|nr:hypothetical protein [Pseudoneobacillus sp.]